MNKLNILGTVAGAMCTLSFLPQALQIYRSKSAKDISLITFIAFCIGVSLWIVYGVYLKSAPLIIANCATLLLGLAILAMKLKYK